jgi:hypothetical protein
MSEHAPDRLWAGIDIPKTIAGVLAAVSAAVVGSFLGVAGTLVGAAVASIVGSVGTEIYHRSIERGKQRLQATFVTAPAAVGTPSVVAAEEESPSEPEPKVGRSYRWGRVAMVAGALFVLAMGVLSAFELTTGKSAADAVGGKSSSGTTIGSIVHTKNKKENSSTVTPTETATPTSDSTAEPSTSPSSATSTEPSADPSSAATTSPDPASTDTATTAPPAVDSGSGDQGTQDSGTGGGASADPTDDTGGSGGGVGTDSVRGSADAPQPDNSGE